MNGLGREKRVYTIWQRIVAAMCCLVVFITTYALILPAITLDSETAENEPGIIVETDEERIAVPETEEEPGPTEAEPLSAEPEAEKPAEPEPEAAEPAEEEPAETEPAETEETVTEEITAETDTEGEEPEEDEALISGPEYRPACSLRARAGDVLVCVEAPEGAFPENVVMEAGIIEDEAVLSVIADTVEGRVRAIQAVDITFFDENGEEIQPAIPIFVTMSSEITDRAEEIQVVHVDEELQAEVVSETGIREDNAVEFSAGDFSVYAIVEVETITESVLTSDGNTYEVTVNFTEEAGIPDDAELHVSELTERDEGYEYYVARTTDAIDARDFSLNYIKLLDIEITDADGRKLEPAAPVDVSIRLMDKELIGEAAQVVHFGDETEVLDSSTNGDTVRFSTDGFSVYAIAEIQDPSELDGQTLGIMNVQDGSKPSGTAMMSTVTGTNRDRLAGKSLTVRVDVVSRDAKVYVAGNSNITMWKFSSCGDGKFHISAVVDDELKYLQIRTDGIYLVDPADMDEDCRITVTKNTGTGTNAGKFKFSTEHGALQLSGGNFTRANATANGNAVWMSFAELSALNDDDFVTYVAQKVSVSGKVNEDGSIDYDVEDGDQVILYTRIWNENTLRYDYYIIDYDGKLVQAYEGGDTISWVGSKVNTMLWDFTEYHYDDGSPNYYYELQNAYSGKYIAPQVSATGFLSDNTIGINLNGRRYNEYYTTVLAWDDPYYDYASLGVRDYQLISVPMARADDFYFAIMTKKEETSDEMPTPVATLDHTTFGITLKMQDYGNITSYNRSQDQVDVLGNTDYNQWTGSPGLLEKNLTGDYPKVKDSTHSLSELYDETLEVNQQFLLSTYNETGYFEYDSTQNFAHLVTSTDDYWYGKERPDGGTYGIGDFVVYDELGTTDEGNKDTLKHGQFLPYNDLMVKKNGEWVPRDYSTKYVNEMDIHATPLSSLDPRKGEKLYSIPYKMGKTAPDYVDHFFGMELSASFMQSESGLDAWGHDLIFEFSGDDDFWLYIDGMLVLDLGGIHSALDGSVNFRTGKVVVNGRNTDLRTLYGEAYREKNTEATDAEVEEWLNTIFADGGTVFKDYTGHTMRMFYMERGAGASNLHMRFNLAPYVNGEVLLEKEVTGTETIDMTFPFQIWYRNSSHEMVRAGSDISVTDVQTGEAAEYQQVYTIDGLTYNDVFFLRPGQTVSIKLPSEDTGYYIKECALDTSVFEEVLANGTELTGEPDDGIRKDYTIEESTVAGRKKVIYENRVSPNALRDLHITKRLWQDNEKTEEIFSGTGPGNDNTEFRFRIYIGTANGGYAVYNTGKYYVKDPEGNYCIYENGGFVSTGKQSLADLDTTVPEGEWKSEKEKATFYSSPSGAIDKIRAGYTIEIPELLPGTPFMIVERDGEIPTGYNLLGYTLTDGAYASDNQGTADNTGTVSADKDDTVSVHNQHGYGLKMNKIWSDAAFMSMHDPVYYAVYIKGSDTPVSDSVRVLVHPSTSLKWFFPSLEEGKTLNDYEVYEVVLTGDGITADPSTGVVSGYSTITRIGAGQTIDVYAEGNEHGYTDTYTYTVDYSRETLSDEQIEENVNSRTDTVYNSRAGIRIIKTDTEGTPLSGAVFELEWTDPDGEVRKKRFMSDEDGLVMVAYLKPDTEYKLREVAAPFGYRSWIDGDLTIRVDSDGVLLINGSPESPEGGEGPYTVYQVADPTPEDMPTLTVRNKPTALRAIKVDLESGLPMQGVTFALYKEVHEAETGAPMPDYTPMEGYEELVTDADGVIPKIVLRNSENPDGLRPGVYYLREVQTPSRYDPLGYDIRITITTTGEIRLDKAMRPEHSGSWVITEITESDNLATLTENEEGEYQITVKNQPKNPVRIRKLNTAGNGLDGVAFSLYKAGQIGDDGKPKEGEEPILSGRTENGLLNLGGLEENTSYYLFETETLEGYRLLDYPILINSVGADNITASINGAPLETREFTEDGMTVWEISVYNYNSVELPATGGPGTFFFTAAGAALSGISVTMLAGRRRKRKRIKGRAGP